jgi:hypothetical protein
VNTSMHRLGVDDTVQVSGKIIHRQYRMRATFISSLSLVLSSQPIFTDMPIVTSAPDRQTLPHHNAVIWQKSASVLLGRCTAARCTTRCRDLRKFDHRKPNNEPGNEYVIAPESTSSSSTGSSIVLGSSYRSPRRKPIQRIEQVKGW